jgi:hypothetical protein
MIKSIKFEYNKNMSTNIKCPHCNIGILEIKKDLLTTKQYKNNEDYMKSKYNSEHFSIFDFVGVIGGLFECSECNDFVSFLGEITGEEEHTTDENGEYYSINISYLDLKYINPPVHIIPIDDKYPLIIQNLLKESYSLYLNHSSSCVNKLRIIVEEILNDLKIPKKVKRKNGRNLGKFDNLTTHKRLEILKQKVKYEKPSKFLLAIKWIGNEGSHSHVDLSTEELLEVYNILQEALDLIYLKTDEKLKKRVDEINKKKGR